MGGLLKRPNLSSLLAQKKNSICMMKIFWYGTAITSFIRCSTTSRLLWCRVPTRGREQFVSKSLLPAQFYELERWMAWSLATEPERSAKRQASSMDDIH